MEILTILSIKILPIIMYSPRSSSKLKPHSCSLTCFYEYNINRDGKTQTYHAREQLLSATSTKAGPSRLKWWKPFSTGQVCCDIKGAPVPQLDESSLVEKWWTRCKILLILLQSCIVCSSLSPLSLFGEETSPFLKWPQVRKLLVFYFKKICVCDKKNLH